MPDSTELFHRALIENALDTLIVADREGKITFYGPANPPITGYAPEQRLGQSIFKTVHPEDLSRVRKVFDEALAHPRVPCRVVYRAQRGNGEWRMVDAVWTNFIDHPSIRGIVYNARDVTERAEAEKKFAKLFLSVPAGVALSDLDDGRIHEANNEYARIFGYDLDDVLGRTSIELGIWTDRADRDRMVERVVKDGRLRGYELTMQTKDGRPIVVTLNADTIEVGGKRCLLSAFVDSTERLQALEALQASETWHRSLIENTHDFIAVLDKDFKVTYYALGNERISGRKPEERLGQSVLDLVHPDDEPALRTMLEELVREPGASRTIRVRGRHKEGDWRILEAIVANLLEVPAIEGIVINAVDVDKRVRAEAALEKSEDELRKSLLWYRTLIENAYDAIVVLDERILFKYVSPSFERMTGWKLEERLGREPFGDIHPDDRPAVRKAFEEVLREPGGNRSVRHRIRRKDGSWLVVDAVGTNLLQIPAIRGIVVNARAVEA
jgi:PAS domain S-box-containing protein